MTVVDKNTTSELSVTEKYGPVATQVSNKELREQLVFEAERREILKEYIRYHLVKGYDYGKIHVVKDCLNKYDCKLPKHLSKYTLLKPGQEKVMSLFHWIPDFKVDQETKDVFSEDVGLVPYICVIYDFNGRFVAQGKGAATLTEVYGSHNNCIKKAKKRAVADALLSSGVLSDFLSLVETEVPERGLQTTTTNSSPINLQCTCKTQSRFHSRTCPAWVDPNTPDEIVNPENIDIDALPDPF